jgi:hypothetical protein
MKNRMSLYRKATAAFLPVLTFVCLCSSTPQADENGNNGGSAIVGL